MDPLTYNVSARMEAKQEPKATEQRHGAYSCCGASPKVGHQEACIYGMSHYEIKKRTAQGLNHALKPEAPAEWTLEQCIKVLAERGAHYTKDKERNWPRITEVFNALTGRDLSNKEALMFMVVLKMVRAMGDPIFSLDHYVDGINYLALAAEAAAVLVNND